MSEKLNHLSNQPSRGVRLNNPFNIRKGKPWKGLSIDQPDKAFCKFMSMEYGIRAFFKIMFTYKTKYHLTTLEQVISRFAPPTENDTKGYIKTVELLINQALPPSLDGSFNRHSVVNAGSLKFPSWSLRELAKAMARVESRYILTDDLINKALLLI